MEDFLKKLNIIFEDNHIIVVEKFINVPTCEDDSKDLDMLTILKEYLKRKYNKPGNVYLGLLHRLDRPVGGIMVFAKTSKAASRISEMIRQNEFEKKYYAIIMGTLDKKEAHLEDYLLKNSKKNIVEVNANGKYASLDYKVISEKEDMSLVSIKLQTGRSHQIRVQFASRGYPLYGDQKYNKKAICNEQIALYSYFLSFSHPISKEKLEFKVNLPDRYPFNIFS